MLRKFLRDRRGSILPIFAIALVPLVVSTGAVIDYTNAYDQRGLVQNALDAAALAAGKQVGIMSTEELEVEAENFFVANVGVGKITNVPTIATAVDGSTVDVNTELHVPTYFLGMIGLDEFVFDLHAQVTIAMGTIEVALVLDNSTSMCLGCDDEDQDSEETKIGSLKIAATDLVETLYALGETSTKEDPVMIGIAPFGGSVNVGPSATFIDMLGKGTYAGDAQKGEGASSTLNPYALFSTLKDSSGVNLAWGGCVEERPGDYGVNDEPPSTAVNPTAEQAQTLFVPMFAPDEPDNWTCSTGSCLYSGSSSSTRRYNGTPTGSVTYNNYLPDAGAGGRCGPAVTTTIATPAVFTKSSHGLAVGTELSFQTSGSLPSGLSTSSFYYVAPGAATNTFWATSATSGTTFTVAVSSATFTVTKANPAVFTKSSHGLTAGTALKLTTTGDMYDPLANGSTYYVISSGLSTNSFRVSTTSGGSAVSTSGGGTQSGTHTYTREGVFTKSSHGLSVGNALVFTTTGSLPTGYSTNTVYYVRSVPSSSTFTVATTSGGAAIFPSGSQSGTHSFYKLVATSGSQSGSHSYTQTADWTCQSGDLNCGGTNNGETEEHALAGVNIPSGEQCKYGTSGNKGVVADITVSNLEGGPNFMCTTSPVVPLTVTENTVTGAISAMTAYGYTNITAGLMWGWRLLSPTEPFTEGREYTDVENKKILILMTDGENTYTPYVSDTAPGTWDNKFVKSAYGAWGYIYKNHLGTTSTTPSTIFTYLNDRTEEACQNVKDAEIEVYTIAFQVDDEDTLLMLEQCATDPSMAYQSGSNEELLAAFAAIGDEISLLRLAQ